VLNTRASAGDTMTEKKSDNQGQTIGSVEKALDVVDIIREKEPVNATEVADSLNQSKSSVSHYLSTLSKRGYIERVGVQYQLGIKFLALGGKAREHERLFRLGKEDADEFSRETGDKVRLITERDDNGITLYQAAGNHIDESETHVGTTEALYCTAAGKAFLAEISKKELDRYLNNNTLKPHTTNTITDKEQLRSELDKVRSSGIAFDDQERYEGVRCVAASITLSDGSILGTFSVSAPVEQMPEDRFRVDIPDRIQNTVTVVKINTTYSEWMNSGIN